MNIIMLLIDIFTLGFTLRMRELKQSKEELQKQIIKLKEVREQNENLIAQIKLKNHQLDQKDIKK